ncbi:MULTISPECIES: ParA family protein [unclassified Coleofasciculus]|uniref:ParA family protein n=1 Tax=unclassified Coleofasciculus TaxID=2692782 RepID=UPI001881C58B|nr:MULTISPECIES: AAA family ATPase [unclassified Coleofasciculus]MBE9129895.1 ParA family protein [Coleofasciculus sp. LEGE 07081]MBE9150615.1 ParA family protein [Coleofasciculus sp. LEGE 07092]
MNVQRSSRVITLFNQSGGVGKTTLTMNLGYTLAQRGHRILLVDLDPQASLTTFMGIEPTELESTLYDALLGEVKLSIHPSIHDMDIAPTNINLSVAELELVSALNREARLKNALLPFNEYYNYILIDCPPSLGLLTVVGLTAATHILVPIETEFKSYFGTGLLLDTIARVRRHVNPELAFAGFVPMKFDGRRSQHTRTYSQMRQELKALSTVFPPVPDSTVFPDSAEERLPLSVFKPKHPAVKVFSEIASGLEKL